MKSPDELKANDYVLTGRYVGAAEIEEMVFRLKPRWATWPKPCIVKCVKRVS